MQQGLGISTVLTEAQVHARDLKHELKDWEAAFRTKHGRAATKEDMLQRPDIARKYRRYSKFKKEIACEGLGSSPKPRPELESFELPMETSKLGKPRKRKASSAKLLAHSEQHPTPLAQSAQSAQPIEPHSSGVPTEAGHRDIARAHSGAQARGEACATPASSKRQRLKMPSIHDMALGRQAQPAAGLDGEGAQPATVAKSLSCSSAEEPSSASTEAGPQEPVSSLPSGVSSGSTAAPDGPEIDDAEWDAVMYRPLPSLIRRYAPQRLVPIRVQTLPQTHPAMPQISSTSALHSPLLQSLNRMTMSDSAPGQDARVNASTFKASAGHLVKTTSISLSVFGNAFHSEDPADPSQGGHSSDDQVKGSTGWQHRTEGGLRDLDAAELVVDDVGQDREDGAPSTHRKKATQKRSTRRVKLRPTDKDGGAAGAKKAKSTSAPNLVSSNFYKIRLKGSRRGASSTEDRRAALYKRMIRGKAKNSADPTGDAFAGSGRNAGARAGWSSGPACSDDDIDLDFDYETASGSWADSDATREGYVCAESAGRARLINGCRITDFAADNSSSAKNVCALPGVDGASVDLQKVLQHVWGFGDFRDGQAAAIQRVLSGQSTILLLATGAGKSLVYQLPSLLQWAVGGGLTLVVTPLVALMRDQMRGLPSGVNGVCLSGEEASSFSDAAKQLAQGKVHFLFVSPERLQSPRFQSLMSRAGVPRVRLAVIDEAHCACEWSHNFRPAYLQLPEALRSLGGPQVLAMTATATATLTARLMSMFAIDAGDVVRGGVLRPNILLSSIRVDISDAKARSTEREEALLSLLRAPDMASLGAVLVYVSTQATADRVAEFLTARSVPAQAYHAGKHAAERARIQAGFMRDVAGAVPIRVLVATVAFGMGLDKSDIRAVVHFNLPRSMEAYVQEVGRAGRDGAPAKGVLLLATRNSTTPADAATIRSWAYSDGVDVAAVRRLLLRLFPKDFVSSAIETAANVRRLGADSTAASWQATYTAVLEIAALQADVDADQAVVQTLLSYLAVSDPASFGVEPNTHRTCGIRFTRTDMGKLAEEHAFFSKLASYLNGKNTTRPRQAFRVPGARKQLTSVTLDVFAFAKASGMGVSEVSSELHHWRAKRELALDWQEPSCVVNVALDMRKFVADMAESTDAEASTDEQWRDQLALCIDNYISSLAASIVAQNEAKIHDSLRKVDCLSSTMCAASYLPTTTPSTGVGTSDMAADSAALQINQNEFIQAAINIYFSTSSEAAQEQLKPLQSRLLEQGTAFNSNGGGGSDGCGSGQDPLTCLSRLVKSVSAPAVSSSPAINGDIDNEARIRIRNFVYQHHAQLKTARAIARIFHALSSPACSSSQWMWCSEWGSMVCTDFEAVRQCAQEELVRLHCHQVGDAAGDIASSAAAQMLAAEEQRQDSLTSTM